MELLNDQELVRKMREGEELAFSQFFDDYFPRLFRFALTRLNGNEDLAEEVVQIAMSRAMRKLDSFRGDAALFTWLCTFCRFEISAHVAKSRAQAPLGQEGHAAGVPLPDVFAVQSHIETSVIVHDVLDRLPAHYGNALEWKYAHGFSVDEIANRMSLGVKAVESLLTRARAAFREVFES